jgi:hypothetical protein
VQTASASGLELGAFRRRKNEQAVRQIQNNNWAYDDTRTRLDDTKLKHLSASRSETKIPESPTSLYQIILIFMRHMCALSDLVMLLPKMFSRPWLDRREGHRKCKIASALKMSTPIHLRNCTL